MSTEQGAVVDGESHKTGGYGFPRECTTKGDRVVQAELSFLLSFHM